MTKHRLLTIKEVNELNAKIADEWTSDLDETIRRYTGGSNAGRQGKGRTHSVQHKQNKAKALTRFYSNEDKKRQFVQTIRTVRGRAISVNGKVYVSISEAAEALDMWHGSIAKRLTSKTQAWKDWFYVDTGPSEIVPSQTKRNFLVVDPDGNEYRGDSLAKFCKKRGFPCKRFYELCGGKKKSYKGWTGRYVKESEEGEAD